MRETISYTDNKWFPMNLIDLFAYLLIFTTVFLTVFLVSSD